MIKKKQIKIAVSNFWDDCGVSRFVSYFPYLEKKYSFIDCEKDPDIVLRSCFNRSGNGYYKINTMSDLAAENRAKTLFFTGENIEPDMGLCDYAISFSRNISSINHIRVPLWVTRLYLVGKTPEYFLSKNFIRNEDQVNFCNFIYSNKIPDRELFFRLVSTRKRVDAPGLSMNNCDPIASSISDKLNFMRNYRFSIAIENERNVGYCTEKIGEAFLSGSVPVYSGDPSVSAEFNPDAFLDIDRCGGYAGLSNALLYADSDRAVWLKMIRSSIYLDDLLPECALEDRAFAFFEKIFD